MNLPNSVVIAFKRLGDAQRGRPENAMLRVQEAMGGGVLSPVVENVGDIIHRMTHMAGWTNFDYPSRLGFAYVEPKVESSLRYLKHPYGFEREMNENIASNARYNNIPERELRAKIDQALRAYAEEHSKLTVYNLAQAQARDAAIAVGLKNWPSAIRNLEALDKHLKTPETWASVAGDYKLDAQGNPLPVRERNSAFYR